MERAFPPGSEWAYFKWYCGETTAERVLGGIASLTTALIDDGIICRWFFIRYADPWPHLRVRFNLTSVGHWPLLIDRVQGFLEPWMSDERVWRSQIDTYVREVERYGADTMTAAEDVFYHDSELARLAATIVRDRGDESMRWQLAVASIAALLRDFALDAGQASALLDRTTSALLQERGKPRETAKALDRLFREHRARIEQLVELGVEDPPVWTELQQARSRAVADVRRIDPAGGDGRMISVIHMTCNRLFMGQPREHELALCWLLAKYYRQRAARRAATVTSHVV